MARVRSDAEVTHTARLTTPPGDRPLCRLVGARKNPRQIEDKGGQRFPRRSVRRDFEGPPINVLVIQNSWQNTASSVNRQPQRAGKDLSRGNCFEV